MYEDVWRHFEQNELTHSAAHHLMAIHELCQTPGYARITDVARHLGVTKGSVSWMMKHLKERGYVKEDANRFLSLSENALRVVREIESTRLVVQRFLTDALGMDGDDAEIDACKVEHLLSAEARTRLVSFLRFLFSEDERAGAFLAALAEQETCPGRSEECYLCEEECLGSPTLGRP